MARQDLDQIEIAAPLPNDELLALNGYYTSLHDKQLLEEELETA